MGSRYARAASTVRRLIRQTALDVSNGGNYCRPTTAASSHVGRTFGSFGVLGGLGDSATLTSSPGTVGFRAFPRDHASSALFQEASKDLFQASKRCARVENARLAQNNTFPGHGHRAYSQAMHVAPKTEENGGPLSYLMLIPSLVCAILAAWQLDRRTSKIAQLERRKAALHSDAQDVFAMEQVPSAFELVTWKGEYDHERSMFVGPRVKTHMGIPTKGWQLVTPCYSLDRRRAILVRRGWVPDDWNHGEGWLDRLRQSHDPALDIGVVTKGELGNSFVAENVPEKGEWYTLHVSAMARAAGLPDNTPMVEVVEVEEEAGHSPSAMQIAANKYRGISQPAAAARYPAPKKRDEYLDFAVMPYDHLNYAITWFALSVATGYLASRLIRGLPFFGKRRRR